MNHAQRNPTLDNLKFLMIFLVVLAHATGPFIYTFPTLKLIFTSIYSFHMPVFIIVSGMLSRDIFSREHFIKLLRTLVIPFIVFTMIYETAHFIMFSDTSKYLRWHIPYWLLWYLPSLFFWRLTLPLIRKIPQFLLISVLGAISIGLVPDVDKLYGISRTIYFWPFFLLGYILTPSFLENILWKKIPKYIWVLLIVGILSQTWLKWDISHKFLYGNIPYSDHNVGITTAVITQIMVLLISIIMSFAVIALVPKKLPLISSWTSNTFAIYLWHGIAINIIIATGFKDIMKTWPLFSVGLMILLFSTALVILLSSQFINRTTQYITFQAGR